jgi:hypothetical protein
MRHPALQTLAKSWELIQERRPERLFLTHFGPADGVEEHFAELRDRLEEWSVTVQDSLKNGQGDDVLRAARFEEQVTTKLKRSLTDREVKCYVKGGTVELSWYGLAHYFRKSNSS